MQQGNSINRCNISLKPSKVNVRIKIFAPSKDKDPYAILTAIEFKLNVGPTAAATDTCGPSTGYPD